MSTEPLVYLKGDLIPASQAKLEIYDAAIVLGATVTDMERTFNQKVFRLDDHMARFYRSCKYARIMPRISADEAKQVVLDMVEHNGSLLQPGQELGIVQFISPGEFRVYAGSAGGAGDMAPTFCMHSFPLPLHFWKYYYTDGIHCVTPSIRHIPPQCTDPKIKCRSRMHWWLADQETHLVDAKAVTLCLDLDGNVTETSGSNFLIYTGGKFISPSPRNILRGISLTTVIEIAEQLGVPFIERDIQVHDVMNADEAYLSSTPYCLAPVTKINGVPIGDGKPGPMLNRVLDAWSERVGVDIVEQIVTSG